MMNRGDLSQDAWRAGRELNDSVDREAVRTKGQLVRLACTILAGYLLLPSSVVSQPFGGHWHDTYYHKDWILSPREDEILVVFSPRSDVATRESIVRSEGLIELHRDEPWHREVVYRVGAGLQSTDIAIRLQESEFVEVAAPAVVDQDGRTCYYVPGQLVIQLNKLLSPERCREVITTAGYGIVFDYWTPGLYRIRVPEGKDVFTALREWYARAELVIAEPVFVSFNSLQHVPNDPLFPEQWALRNTGQQHPGQQAGTPHADIQATDAWDITRGRADVLVVVVDSGMDLDHEDLQANLLPRGDEDWDFACPCDPAEDPECAPCDPNDTDYRSPDDGHSNMHGTKACGVAIAVQNSVGMSGVAPDCRVMPLRQGTGDNRAPSRADAINFAASKRSQFRGLVINCSWSEHSGIVRQAIENAFASDCVIVCSAGNDDQAGIGPPASYPQTIAVGWTNRRDRRARLGDGFYCLAEGGSNWGPELDVVAPGKCIWATTDPNFSPYVLYQEVDGSSFAAPVVSGICALILSADPANPAPDAFRVKEILQESAEDLVGDPAEDSLGRDDYMGYGRANAYRAVQISSGYPLIDVGRRDLADGSAGQGVAWGDYDNDGDLDLYVVNTGSANKLLRNDGAEIFVDVGGPTADPGPGTGAAWGDYDNDGDLDLYLANAGTANRLFRNELVPTGQPNFVPVSSPILEDTGNGQAVAWGDYDNDGWLDLYLVNDGGADKLFHNERQNDQFTDSGLLGDAGPGRAAAWADYDNDGDLDLYLVKCAAPNILYQNQLVPTGQPGFTDGTGPPLDDAGCGQAAAWADYDNDGWLDLCLVNNPSPNKLFNNNGGTFSEVPGVPFANNGRGVAWGDYDNDGDLDLYLSNDGPNTLLRNQGGGSFVDAAVGPLAEGGSGRGVAWGDYNRDGGSDLYLANAGPNKLFRNRSPSSNHWLQVKLLGAADGVRNGVSNRSGIGARVRVVTGVTTQICEVSGGSGYRSQNSLTTSFGLGSAALVDRVEVLWPSGELRREEQVGVDQEITVQEWIYGIQVASTQFCQGNYSKWRLVVSWQTTVPTTDPDVLEIYQLNNCEAGGPWFARVTAASGGTQHSVTYEGPCGVGTWKYRIKSSNGTSTATSACRAVLVSSCPSCGTPCHPPCEIE